MLRGLITLMLTSTSLRDCSTSQKYAQITKMSIQPDAPVRGDNVTLAINYNLFSTITGGTAEYRAILNGIPFPGTSEPLCDEIGCPKDPGSYVQYGSNVLPDITGKVVSSITWKNQDGQELWCAEVTFRMSDDEL